MDEVVAFIKKWWIKEYMRLGELYYKAPLDKYNQEVEKFDKLFEMKGGAHLKQVVPADPEMGKQQLEGMKAYSPPALMLVRRYDRGGAGTLYRGYVSVGYIDSGPSYFQSLYVAPRKDGLKFVALYHRCEECGMTGAIKGKTCAECGGAGWKHMRGLDIGDPGRVVEVRRLVEPDDAIDKEDYHSAEGLKPKKAGKK